jgi:hypothetical protein
MLCQRTGCSVRYTEDSNPPNCCVFHPGAVRIKPISTTTPDVLRWTHCTDLSYIPLHRWKIVTETCTPICRSCRSSSCISCKSCKCCRYCRSRCRYCSPKSCTGCIIWSVASGCIELQPVFHDGLKEWSCCKAKSHDFGEFMDIKGYAPPPPCGAQPICITKTMSPRSP